MSRNIGLDALKCLMAVMVVGLHASIFKSVSEKLNFVLCNGIFRIAVPIFLIISGYYFSLLTKSAWKSWLKRIGILYVFWMIFYLPFYGPLETNFTAAKIESLLTTLFFGYFHLWYVSAMFFAGVILFSMRDWPLRRIFIAAVALYAIGSIIQYVKYFFFYDIPTHAYRNFLFFALPMMMIGLATAKTDINLIKQKFIILAVLSSTVLFCFEILLAHRFAIWRGGFDMYLSLIILCPALFIACARSNLNLPFRNLSLLASVIYFTHALFLALLARYAFNGELSAFAIAIAAAFVTFLAVAKLPKKYRAVF